MKSNKIIRSLIFILSVFISAVIAANYVLSDVNEVVDEVIMANKLISNGSGSLKYHYILRDSLRVLELGKTANDNGKLITQESIEIKYQFECVGNLDYYDPRKVNQRIEFFKHFKKGDIADETYAYNGNKLDVQFYRISERGLIS